MRTTWPQIESGITLTGDIATPFPRAGGAKAPRYVLLTSPSAETEIGWVRVFVNGETVDPKTNGFIVRPYEPLLIEVVGADRIQAAGGAGAALIHVTPVEDRVLQDVPAIHSDSTSPSVTASTPTDVTIPVTKSGKPAKFVRVWHDGAAADTVQVLPGLIANVDVSKGPYIRAYESLVLNVAGHSSLAVVASSGPRIVNVAPLENSGWRQR